MKIILASDHRGYEMKNQLVSWLAEQGHQVVDGGNTQLDPGDDYPDFVIPAAKQVAVEPGSFGVFLCGSGAGANVAANKVRGVRASLSVSVDQVKAARNDDDINVLVVAADYLNFDQVQAQVSAFLATNFAGEERYVRRLNKIMELDQSL